MESTMEIPVSDVKTEPEYPYYINCNTEVTIITECIGSDGKPYLPKLYQSNCSYECDGTTIYVASTKSTVTNDIGLEYKPSLIQTTVCTCTEVVSEDECRECRTECSEDLGSMSMISSYICDIGIDKSGYVCNAKFLGYTNVCSIVNKGGKTETCIDECTLKVYDNEYYVYDNRDIFTCIVCGTIPSSNCTLCRITDYNDLYKYTFNGTEWSKAFKPMYVYDPMDCNKFVKCIDGLAEGDPIPATYTYIAYTEGKNYYNVKECCWQSDEIRIDPPYQAIYVAQGNLGEDNKTFTGSLSCIVCHKGEWSGDTYKDSTACTKLALPSTSKSIDKFCCYVLCGTVKGTTFTPTKWVICEKKDENNTGTLSQS